MKWVFNLIISLLCLQVLEASTSQIYLGSRESDPASLVENVSTIHGDYTEVEVDLTVSSPDSLVLSRFYTSRDTLQTANFGGWRFNPHCFLSIQKDPKGKPYTTSEGKFERTYVYVGNPDGAILTYVGWQNTTNPSKKSLFKIDPEGDVTGIANTAKGTISCWTNLKNNELYFDPQTNSFELFLCSEGKRFYSKHPSLDVYFITQEVLPSGIRSSMSSMKKCSSLSSKKLTLLRRKCWPGSKSNIEMGFISRQAMENQQSTILFKIPQEQCS